jgi:carbamate kinase
VLSHGNGRRWHDPGGQGEYGKAHGIPFIPLSVCVAMSQGYIGYDLQNALREELILRGAPRPVSTVLTQVRVDPADPAFENPPSPSVSS